MDCQGKRYIVESDKIANNVRKIIEKAGNAQVYAVVKSDGYGTGCKSLARICAMEGIKRFAVTDACEVEDIIQTGLQWDEILVLKPVPDSETTVRLMKIGVTLTVASTEDARVLSKLWYLTGIRPKAQVKIDTGMGRRGFLFKEIEDVCRLYSDYSEIDFVGIYTHFCNSLNDRTTKRQYKRFTHIIDTMRERGIEPGICHCCNSSAMFYHDDMIMDAVRVGSALFGRISGWEKFGLMKTGFCLAPVECIRVLTVGTTVGYGAGYMAEHDTITAVCSVGSHNGFGLMRRAGKQRFFVNATDTLRYMYRRITNRDELYASVRGIKCPVLGSVGSETVVLDVSSVRCKAGDMAVFDINPMLMGALKVTYI